MRKNPDRLRQLQALSILDTAPEQVYDDLTLLLTRSLDVPIGMVNLLDGDRDWFKGCVGLPMSQSPADTSFCEVFFNTATDMVVAEDTTLDPRFASHPFVTGAPFIRFYAAARLTVGQQTVGTLCVYDTRPHRVSAEQLLDLRILASAAVCALEGRIPPAVVPEAASQSIVLVDDDTDSARAWSELMSLVAPEFAVTVRADWPSAIATVLGTRPWAVIADLKAASLESLAPVASIRAVLGEDAPILIAISADVARLDALARGYDHAIGKPVEIDSLLRVLARLTA